MKKILAALLCAGVITVSFAGCTYQDALFNSSGSSQAAQGDAQATTEPEAKAADFEKNLAGLSQYFEKLGIIAKAEKADGDQADPYIEMDASLVGAEAGRKYAAGSVTIELYEYKTTGLGDTAKEIIGEIEKNGSFSILELPEVKAYLSNSKKFMMIYTDKSINDEKPDENADNYKKRQNAVEKLAEF